MSLGTCAKKGWWGASHKYEAQQGGFHGDSASGNQPCLRPLISTVTLKKLQWKYSSNTVLTWDRLPTREGRGRVENCLQNTVATPLLLQIESYSKWRMQLIRQHMARSAGRVDLRLTLPKLYLATSNIIQYNQNLMLNFVLVD